MSQRVLPKGKRVLMVGPSPEGRGGMAAVAAAYRDAGVFARWDVCFINTMSSSGALGKLGMAFLAWCQLLLQLLAGHVALAHVHVASGVSFWRKAVLCWTCYAFGVPVLVHVHGGNFVDFYQGLGPRRQRFMRATLARARRVIVLSPRWVARLSVMLNKPTAALALENPVAPWPRPERRLPRPEELNGSLNFLFLGRLERDKGIEDLLDAFAIYLQAGWRGRLLLAGDGDRAATLDRAARLGITEHLELLGWVSGVRKQQALADADVFVLPSHIEGLPVAMLEAMYCGLPVVICPVGSIPEVLHDGVDALLVPARDVTALAGAMRSLAADAGLRERLGSAGKALFDAQYSMASIGPRLDALYEETLVGAATARR